MTDNFDNFIAGGRDRQRKFHGKGTIEFEEDGSFLSGVWEHGIKHGLFKIETTRNGVCYIEADYKNGKMNGKVLIRFKHRCQFHVENIISFFYSLIWKQLIDQPVCIVPTPVG